MDIALEDAFVICDIAAYRGVLAGFAGQAKMSARECCAEFSDECLAITNVSVEPELCRRHSFLPSLNLFERDSVVDD